MVHVFNGIGKVFRVEASSWRVRPQRGVIFASSLLWAACSIYCKSALLNVIASHSEAILLVFCQVPQSDVHVRNALGTRKVVRRAVGASLRTPQAPEYLVHMLKAIDHLSTNGILLEVLQNANTI
ncbi:hypothetical protein H4582DRAFT_1962507 [Lactarius indigo]|nr:hypothetical protein H4582DRAFT_1962507 [Lactarius indigo]